MKQLVRSWVLPHLTEDYDFDNKIFACKCDICGVVIFHKYLEHSMDLNSVAIKMSFVDRHKHDEWPDIIGE